MRLLTVALLASLAVARGAAAKDPEGCTDRGGQTLYAGGRSRAFPAFSDYLYAELEERTDEDEVVRSSDRRRRSRGRRGRSKTPLSSME